jgi:hypothetical protein
VRDWPPPLIGGVRNERRRGRQADPGAHQTAVVLRLLKMLRPGNVTAILTWARPILTGPARAGVSDEWAAGTKPLRGIGGPDHVSRSGRGILLRIRRAGGPPPCRAGQYRVRSNLSNSWPGRSRCPVRQAS